MATTVSITSTYAGELAAGYISALLKNGQTLSNELITIKDNIAYKQVIKKFATSGLLAAGVCDFTDAGTITVSERYLELKKAQVNVEICKDEFIADFENMGARGTLGDFVPTTFADFLIANIGLTVGADVETAIWKGNSTLGLSGLTQLMVADNTVKVVTGTTLTTANIVAEVVKVIEKIPATVYGAAEKPKLYLSSNAYRLWILAQGAIGSGMGYRNEAGTVLVPATYAGLDIVEVPGLDGAVGEIVAAQKSNIWFGTSLYNALNEVSVLDMSGVDGSRNVRFISRFMLDVNYGIGSEIVIYRQTW